MKHHLSLPSLNAALTLGLSLTTLTAAAPHHPLRRQSPTSSGTSRNIYVAGYDGLVRTLHYDGASSLTLAHTSPGCEDNPTWLTIQPSLNRLWCLDEGWSAGYGTLNLFNIQTGGALSHQLRHNLSASPVQTQFYGPDDSYLAIAQYGGPADSGIRGGITLHEILADGSVGTSYNHTFPALTAPGPRSAQDIPRGHGVTLDPTGSFIVVSDLGADQVRTFAIDAATGDVSENGEVQMPIGSGPRHAEFAKAGQNTYLFLISEFANSITTFAVTYSGGKMEIAPVHEISTFGPDADPEVIARSSAAEIAVSPDSRFVVVSNRNDASFGDSDSLASFAIQEDGSLEFVQLASAGGTRPRHFEINEKGDRVVVAAQGSERIVVLERDGKSGKIVGELVGLEIETGGSGTPAAIWG